MLEVTEIGSDQEVLTLQTNQLLNLSYSCWEGTDTIHGVVGDTAVSGFRYVELTGYADSRAGEF